MSDMKVRDHLRRSAEAMQARATGGARVVCYAAIVVTIDPETGDSMTWSHASWGRGENDRVATLAAADLLHTRVLEDVLGACRQEGER